MQKSVRAEMGLGPPLWVSFQHSTPALVTSTSGSDWISLQNWGMVSAQCFSWCHRLGKKHDPRETINHLGDHLPTS